MLLHFLSLAVSHEAQDELYNTQNKPQGTRQDTSQLDTQTELSTQVTLVRWYLQHKQVDNLLPRLFYTVQFLITIIISTVERPEIRLFNQSFK